MSEHCNKATLNNLLENVKQLFYYSGNVYFPGTATASRPRLGCKFNCVNWPTFAEHAGQ